jgi:hypothetical protein
MLIGQHAEVYSMFKRQFTRYLIILAVLVLSFAFAVPTFACSPAPGHYPSDFTFEQRIDNAPLVLVGRVVGGTSGRLFTIDTAEVEVETYIKGEGLAVVHIAGFGDGGGDCLNNVRVGERYLFFANGTGDTLIAEYLTVYDAAYEADAAMISSAIAYSGQSNEPMPLPFATQMQRTAKKYAPFGIGALALAGVIGGAVAFKRRNGRKSKAKRGE